MIDDSGITLITCSGISNTGKLTTKVGEMLIQHYPGLIEHCLSARSDSDRLCKVLDDAEQVVILDGCPDCCGKKKILEHKCDADIHLIATESGIVKNGMEDPRFDEIELIARVVKDTIRNTIY